MSGFLRVSPRDGKGDMLINIDDIVKVTNIRPGTTSIFVRPTGTWIVCAGDLDRLAQRLSLACVKGGVQ